MRSDDNINSFSVHFPRALHTSNVMQQSTFHFSPFIFTEKHEFNSTTTKMLFNYHVLELIVRRARRYYYISNVNGTRTKDGRFVITLFFEIKNNAFAHGNRRLVTSA